MQTEFIFQIDWRRRSGASAGGVDYAAASAMEKRFEKRLSTDKQLGSYITKVEIVLNIET